MKVIGWSAITILTLGAGAWFTMLRMPGVSYLGAAGPLTADETTLSSELRKDVEKLAIEIGERNLVHYEGLSAAATYLERGLSEAGYRVERNEFESTTANGPRTTYNIVAELEGAQRPKEIVIVGAHYDSREGTPGADDNASGSAAVLALARRLARSSPGRTLRFVFFTNEEYFRTDIRGSLRYARLCRARNENIAAMLSLETIGYYSDVSGSQRHPFPLNMFYPSTGDFLCVVGNVASRSLVRTVTGSFRKVAKVASEGVAAPGSIDGVGWSDQLSFWEQGYPGIMITDTAPFRNPNYHGSSDTPETLDYRRLARVVVGLDNAVRELVGVKGK